MRSKVLAWVDIANADSWFMESIRCPMASAPSISPNSLLALVSIISAAKYSLSTFKASLITLSQAV